MADHTVQADASAVARGTSSAIVVICALAALATLATNIFLPSLPQLARDLHVSSAAATSAIPVFLLAFSVTQLVVGPLSDRFGRNTPALAGLVVAIVGTIWCAYAQDLTGFLIGRVVQGCGAGAAGVLARAIARDLYDGNKLERAMSYITISTAAAPGFSPLLGGALDHFSAGAGNSCRSPATSFAPWWDLRSTSAKPTMHGAARHRRWRSHAPTSPCCGIRDFTHRQPPLRC